MSSSSRPVEAYSCDTCSDTGWVQVTDEDGRNRGVRRCACLDARIREAALAKIPSRYRRFTLDTVRPLSNLHEKQAAALWTLRGNPDATVLLFGRNGCGKSLFGWLLYRRAVEAGRPVAGLSTADLLLEYRKCEMDEDAVASVDAETLRHSSKRWLLFLDEFEKARPSEFASEALFRLIDAAYSHNHQVVITSNLTPKALQQHWSRASEHYGPSIMRRLFELEDAVSVEMF